MVVGVLRNLRARAGRSILTIAGIAIGILALVVVGSLAERLGTIVTRSTGLNNGAIFAMATRGDIMANDQTDRVKAAIAKIRTFRGVRAIVPEVILPYSLASSRESSRFGPPSLIFGFPPEARQFSNGAIAVRYGRDLQGGDVRAAMIGADFAASAHATLGTTISLYGNSFHVVGVIDKSFTIFDAAIVVPFAQAQALMLQIVQPMATTLPKASASALMVVVEPHADTALIAKRISFIAGLQARDPAEVAGSIRSTTQIFDAIIFGAALIALLVGAFSIVNTMTIAVTERTREIGIRKAIGARDDDILREFLIEAGAIGLLGGLVGLAAAAGVVGYVDAHNASSGNLELFAITVRLALGSVAFAVVLSVIAGLIPAIRAARLDPTEALRRNA